MRPRVHLNFLPGFFTHPVLQPTWRRLESIAEVTRSSVHTPEDIDPWLHDLDAIIMWSWPQPSPAQLDRLGARYRYSGHPDLLQAHAKALLDRGIAVSCSRAAYSPAVAEMALTLILSSLRRSSQFHAAMWAGKETWVNDYPTDIDPRERQLTGRNIGIVGFGRIGRRLRELLRPFHCTVRVYDPYLPEDIAVENEVTPVSLETLASESEIVVLAAAANAGTSRLFHAGLIERLPKDAVLVNVARAALVDGDALLARLRRGDISAALDVFEKEPLAADSPFRALPNVLLSPHRAGGILESLVRKVSWLVDDFEAHLAGRPRAHALTTNMLPSLDA